MIQLSQKIDKIETPDEISEEDELKLIKLIVQEKDETFLTCLDPFRLPSWRVYILVTLARRPFCNYLPFSEFLT